MPTVAIAGGNSIGLGRSMVLAILQMYPAGQWTPMVLSRGPKRPLWLQAVDPSGTRVPVHAVDYDDEEQLQSVLKGVHTVISVMLAKDGTQAQKQIALLNAAVGAGCKRFAPSQWANGVHSWDNVSLLRMLFAGVWEACTKYSDRIECARFNNGGFMNYFGIGAYDSNNKEFDEDHQLQELKRGNGYLPGDDEACEGVDREGDMPDGTGSFLVSMSSSTAEVPMRDDGQYPRMTFTTIGDVGRFLAASLNLPKWEPDMSMAGDTLRADELINIVESVTGKPVQVTKLTRAELEKEIGELEMPQDMLKGLWLELKLVHVRDAMDEAVLNPVVNKLCPEVKPVTVRQYLQKYWSKSESREP